MKKIYKYNVESELDQLNYFSKIKFFELFLEMKPP